MSGLRGYVPPPLQRSGMFAAAVFADSRLRRWALLALDEAFELEPGLSPSGVFESAAERFPEFHPCWEVFRYWAPRLWVQSERPV